MNYSRAEQLLDRSQAVLRDCALGNGAIIAANSDLEIYPSTAENYRYSWMRDAAFYLVAGAEILPDARDIKHRYLEWLTERVYHFSDTGLYIKRYSTNGSPDERYGTEYQPDQAGAMLWALDETTHESDKQTGVVMKLLARGLVKQWDTNHFKSLTQDPWENRTTEPAIGDVFTYSLASVVYGMDRAIKRFGIAASSEVDEWRGVYEQMRETLTGVTGEIYSRRIYPSGKEDTDSPLDASLAALSYPFNVPRPTTAIDGRANNTLEAIHTELYLPDGGTMRYKGDTYDGIVRANFGEATAGRWPLLTFWQSTAQIRAGIKEAGTNTYWDAIDTLDNHYRNGGIPNNIIPEQLFPDTERQGKGVLPLVWSHSMFVLATKELGLLNSQLY